MKTGWAPLPSWCGGLLVSCRGILESAGKANPTEFISLREDQTHQPYRIKGRDTVCIRETKGPTLTAKPDRSFVDHSDRRCA